MHGQGGRYLRLFWGAISQKLPGRPGLCVENTKVTTEYVITENRRIDIVLDDGALFVPIEVKIRAGDQRNQLASYVGFARTKNKSVHVPALYLTVDGHEPQDSSKADLGKDDYVPLSFRDDILAWLEECARELTPETTTPVRENLRQFIAALKSLCGKPEEKEMEDAIIKLVTKDDDTVRAALAISGAMDFSNRAREQFKDSVTALVKKEFPAAVYSVEYSSDGNWYMIQVAIDGGNYVLDVHYDWTALAIEVCFDKKDQSNPQVEKRISEEISKWVHQTSIPQESGFAFYGTRYPGLESVDEKLYLYRLYKEYAERPREAADKIIAIARALARVVAEA
jgi:hypothetical protein